MYYSWETIEAFEAWHGPVMTALGIPFANRNAKTGEIDEDATWTTAYTELRVDDNSVKYAKVEDEIAERFPEGLGTPHTPYFEIEEF